MSKTVFGTDEELTIGARDHIVIMLQKERDMYERQVKRLGGPLRVYGNSSDADWIRASKVYLREFDRAINLVQGDSK